MKKALVISLICLTVIASLFSLPLSSNNSYERKLINDIKRVYNTKDTIKNVNLFNNYYILTTTNNIIVLNNKFEEITTESLSKTLNLDYPIVYKNNKLMYEKKKVSSQKIIYKYYDLYTEELLDTITMEV